jgi:putative ABC transport system permease protein
MLKNYIKTAWRNLLKNKSFSVINILGLSIGLACFILIALFVINELSYDRYNKKADRIFRINSDILFGGTSFSIGQSPDPIGAALKNDYPQVEQFTRIFVNGSREIKKGNEFINEPDIANVDSTFFDVFSLPALYGDTRTALNDPNTVVITERMAIKYFNNPNAVGETIERGNTPYKVTAVIKDMPVNSHFRFDFFFSMDNVRYQWGNYLSNNFYTYIVLKEGVNYKAFERKFAEVINKYILPQARQYMDIKSMDEFEKAGNKLKYSLVPVTEIHLRSDRTDELEAKGNIQYVYIFSVVAVFILLIACINFMNLSTARSSNRAKEVAVRKVLGSQKGKLIGQFLVESVTVALISTVIALGLVYLLLPYYNNMTGKLIALSDLLDNRLLVILVLMPLIVGLLAGSYPAFYLSRFQPITVLKGQLAVRSKKSFIRNALVVFQFTTCIILIVGTLVVYSQLSFIQNTNPGFNKEQVLIVNNTGALGNQAKAFKEEVLTLPGIVNGTYSGYLPVPSYRSDYAFSKDAVMDSHNGFNMQVWQVDENYIPVFGMEVLKGRNFSREFGDSNSLIINETIARTLGPGDPVGKVIYSQDFSNTNKMVPFRIIGLLKNFHFQSMKQNIGPLALAYEYSPYAASFRLKTKDMQGLIKKIEAKWTAMAPAHAFSYRFLDDSFNEMYKGEQRVGKIAIAFALLAILIACLGLFGLVTYMAEQRVKEIGIRKVLGATMGSVMRLLSKDFLRLVMIAFVIAAPVAWWVMHNWLEDFAYRVNLHWWVFAAAGGIALFIALVTVSVQAIKAALANPIKSLRTE